MALKSTIYAGIAFLFTSAQDLQTTRSDRAAASAIPVPDGSASGKANKVFSGRRTLTASATENLDLAGSLTDPHGGTLTFTAIKAIEIRAAAGNTNDVVIGGAASNTWVGPFADATDKIRIKPGGVAVLTNTAAGWAVTAGTGDILLVANGGGTTSVTYDIVIIGVG